MFFNTRLRHITLVVYFVPFFITLKSDRFTKDVELFVRIVGLMVKVVLMRRNDCKILCNA
jgi:hypothetical protein